MITLSATNHTLDYTCTAVTTNPVEFVVAWTDHTEDTYTPAGNNSSGAGPGPTTLLAAPGADTQRQIKYLSVHNADTASNTFTWLMNIGGTRRTIRKVTLAVGETLVWDGVTWKTYTAIGEEKVITSVVEGITYSGSATLDFGSTMTDAASVVVTGETWVTTTSPIHAFFVGDTTSDNTADDHEHASHSVDLSVITRVAGTGFTISAYAHDDFATGQFTVRWEGT